MLARVVVAVILVVALAACQEEGPPAELVEVADRSEEIDFSNSDAANVFDPLATSHRFFKDASGYNLGVSVAFDDPQREPLLTFHIDDEIKGAASQYQELRRVVADGMLPSSSEREFCATEGQLVECYALDGEVVTAARARAAPRFVQRLLDVGRDYGRRLTAED